MEEDNNHEQISVEKKLGDLMLRGWILLAEHCPSESCGVPLMKSPNGQKYCVGCEAWHFDKEQKRQKFTELVSLEGKQNIQVKPTDVQKLPKSLNINFSINSNVIQSLNIKLAYLSNLLNNENDLQKTKFILESMKICMENIQIANKLD